MRTARAIIAGLGLAACLGLAPNSNAQTVTTILPFNATWRYNQSGTDLGTAWRAPTYNDATWLSGPGILQGGETTVYPVPFGTAMNAPGGRITDYFRTSFFFSGSTNNLQLFATNHIDDGCVIYLNGVEAGRIRVAANQTFQTFATALPAEPGTDILTLNPALLRPNQQNYVAVEVHQPDLTSSDVVMGMRLVISQSTALSITTQPQSQTVVAGDTVTFSVGISGGPANYRWQKDQVDIPNATNSTYVISPVSIGHAGTYRVIVSNTLGSLTSSNAVLTVFQDTEGPVMLSAVLLDSPGNTNSIEVTFDEPISVASGNNTNNIRVVRAGTFGANSVYATVSNVLVSARVARLRMGGPNWDVRSNYYVIANNVTDQKGNLIAVNSVIPVAQRIRTNVIQMSAYWDYYDNYLIDTDYGESLYSSNQWYKPNYVPDALYWGTSYGIFFKDLDATGVTCVGDSLNLDQSPSFQFQPLLFRTRFNLGTNYGAVGPITGTIGIRHMIDDGMVLYLNGVEIYRFNVAAPAGTPVTSATRAAQAIDNPTCTTNIEITVTNLLPRTNWLAAALVQTGSGIADLYFGLELDGIFPKQGPLPANGPAGNLKLTAVCSNNPPRVTLTWPNSGPNIYYGYILEGASALAIPGSNTFFLSVSNQSNGVVIPTSMPAAQRAQFYRLRKGPNSPP